MSAVEKPEGNSEHREEQKALKRKISLSICSVCGSEEAKYRCPGCLKLSCSLLCVKKHKTDSGCGGVRDKTAFVTLSQFDEMTLLSDYRFLEDTGRFADSADRDKLIRAPRITLKAKRLASNARKMNITLRFLPITFTKSRENSTIVTKEKQFMWHLKLIFPQSNTEFTQRRVCDKQTLEQILTPYIHPTESDPVTRQKLKIYVRTPFDHVKVFMKAEGRKANSLRYHQFNLQKSLRDNLSYKTLIEYPVLHVVLQDHWNEYQLKGPAEPVSACSSIATKTEGVDHERKDVKRVSASQQEPHTPRGTNIWMGTSETSPDIEPPQQKRAKREAEEKDLEEGELRDSSEEKEEDEEKDSAEKRTLCNKSCDDAKRVPESMETIKEQLQDSVNIHVDIAFNKPNDRSRALHINQNVAGSTDDNAAATDSAEVGVTKEDAVKESEPVYIHHCQDENESVKAADSCGLE